MLKPAAEIVTTLGLRTVITPLALVGGVAVVTQADPLKVSQTVLAPTGDVAFQFPVVSPVEVR